MGVFLPDVTRGPASRSAVSASQGNAIINSLIGPDISGSNTKYFLNNSGDGIDIIDAAGTTVGFTGTAQNPTAVAGNAISGNLGAGVSIGGTASKTVLLDNKIGTDITGTFSNVKLANQDYGVVVGGSSTGTTIGGTITVPSTTVGGTALGGTFNVISGNQKGGIELDGDQGIGPDRGEPDRHERHRDRGAGQQR